MDQKIYEVNYIAVYKYILYLTNDAQLAHGLLQETFYRFYRQQTSNIDNPKAFLLRIARNIVYDHFRKKRIVQFFTLTKDERIDESPLPEEVVEKGEEVEALYKALQQLKFSYREVIVLRYIEDYSVKETAIILGQSEAHIKNNTTRGLQALRKLLEGGEGNARTTIKEAPIDRSE